MFDVYDGLINWFTGLLLCIHTPVCPEPSAALRSRRPREYEHYYIFLFQLTDVGYRGSRSRCGDYPHRDLVLLWYLDEGGESGAGGRFR